MSQVTRALIQLTLRHESQLQAAAAETQFIVFLQGDPQGLLHLLLQESAKWKEFGREEECAIPTTAASLSDHDSGTGDQGGSSTAFQTSGQAMDDVGGAEVVTKDGAWNYMQWDAQAKKMIPSSKAPMKNHIQELNELARDPSQILRFKSLKRPTQTPEKQIYPWLLQISLRHLRL